jgi:hypothetical protein
VIDGIIEIKRKFHKRIGFFGQKYLSIRTSGYELTVDNLTPSERYLVCLCTPYNERLDEKKHKEGIGGGEVKESWIFDNEVATFHFIESSHLV